MDIGMYSVGSILILREGDKMIECPHCKEASRLPQEITYHLWIEQNWNCPKCGKSVKSSQMREV